MDSLFIAVPNPKVHRRTAKLFPLPGAHFQLQFIFILFFLLTQFTMENVSSSSSPSIVSLSSYPSESVETEYDHELPSTQEIGKILFSATAFKHVRTNENYNIILPASSTMGSLLLGSIHAAVDPIVLSQNTVRLIVQCSDGHKGSITKERRKFAFEMETSNDTNTNSSNSNDCTRTDTVSKTDTEDGSLPNRSIRNSPAHVLELAFEDFDHIDLLDYIKKSLPIIHYYRVRGYNVFINCAAGRSRSTSILLAYLMIHERLNFTDALRLVRSKRPVVQI